MTIWQRWQRFLRKFYYLEKGFILLVSFRKNHCLRCHIVVRWELLIITGKEKTRSLKIKQQHQLILHRLVSKYNYHYFLTIVGNFLMKNVPENVWVWILDTSESIITSILGIPS